MTSTYAIVDFNEPSGHLFYVYALLDTRKPNVECGFEPFYIGKGSKRRALAHLQNYKSAGDNPIKIAKINKIRKEGLEPKVVLLLVTESEDEAYLQEAEAIKRFGRLNLGTGVLANLDDGGWGTASGRVVSAETKAAISRSNSGKKRTAEYCQRLSERVSGSVGPWAGRKRPDIGPKISAKMAGRTQSKELVKKRIAPLRGRKRPPEVMAKILQTKRENRLKDPEGSKLRASALAKRAWITKKNKAGK